MRPCYSLFLETVPEGSGLGNLGPLASGLGTVGVWSSLGAFVPFTDQEHCLGVEPGQGQVGEHLGQPLPAHVLSQAVR